MTVKKKIFSAERQMMEMKGGPGADTAAMVSGLSEEKADRRHREVLGGLAAIAKMLREQSADKPGKSSAVDEIKQELAQSDELKKEIQALGEAIENTKREIAAIRPPDADPDHIMIVSNELDAIIQHTEQATETILTCAEHIDEQAHTLAHETDPEAAKRRGDEISDQVVRIFEACNFQDLTGQRINKVVTTLMFIEERVNRMMEIWGGKEGFAGVEVEKLEHNDEDAALLNGPQLENEGVSQDDIDALFD